MKKIFLKTNKKSLGFTLIEMIVAISIFAIMTALVLTKYGTFNQGVILTNLAFDVALNIRNAQSYGLNVKSAVRDDNAFDNEGTNSGVGGTYGVHFDSRNTTGNNAKFILFADLSRPAVPNYVPGVYSTYSSRGIGGIPDEDISVTNIQKRSVIGRLCVSMATDCSSSGTIVDTLDITFKRPDPNAIIMAGVAGANPTKWNSAEITIKAIDGTIKKVLVNSTGQISVI